MEDPCPGIRSFDLFDTLLGRLHFRPASIFDLVERDFPFPGFVFFRMAAEYKSNRTLPDIYRQFLELTGITEDQSSTLMRFELETELREVFPIMENLNAVKDGDLIVSDTYYNENQVRLILDKIGLRRDVRIYASVRGKSSGKIWDVIKRNHAVECHLGDNPHSDVASPMSCGIAAVHYSDSGLSVAERAIMKIGQSELAFLMRALRLQNPYSTGSPEYLIWREQSQMNVPLLLEASLYLDEFCRKHSKRRILFTSRDGCLWIQIFRKLFPQYDSIYFHASRYTYTHPSPSYIAYVQSVHTDDALIVDAHGKGFSCEKFFRSHLGIEPAYLAIVNSGRKHHAIVRKRNRFEAIESINPDLCGTLFDAEGDRPKRCEPEYDLRFIRPIHACMEKCVEIIAGYSFGSFEMRVVDWALKSISSGLILEKFVQHTRCHCHVFEGGVQQHEAFMRIKNLLIKS